MSHQDSFVDYVKLTAEGGNGGHGCISFRREKFVPFGGPDGGDGGKGGDVWLEVDPRLGTLLDVRFNAHVRAGRGGHGGGKNMSGRGGEDRVIYVPAGTSVTSDEGELLADLTQPGERWLAAAGGRGGAGNQHYPTSTNQAPRKAKDGEEGQRRVLVLELKIIADAGLVGLPNAGKSTLLKALTRAHPRIASYPFTTLHPNLGMMDAGDFKAAALADIPGLIEGASRGVGLGDRFLRHIERTGLLVHLVAPDPEMFTVEGEMDPESIEIGAHHAVDAYRLVRRELLAYSNVIAEKPEILVLSKIDLLPPGGLEIFRRVFTEEELSFHPISAEAGEGLEELRAVIVEELRRMGRLAAEGEAPSCS